MTCFFYDFNYSMVKDMAGTMVKNSDFAIRNRFKALRVILGPLANELVCYHPDTIKIVYRSGKTMGVFSFYMFRYFLISEQQANSQRCLIESFTIVRCVMNLTTCAGTDS